MPHVKSNFAPHRDKFGNTLIEEGLPCPAEGYLHNNGFNGLHTLTGVQICKPMNLDLDNGEPIGRIHDGELWFRVNVKDPNEPFKIAVNGLYSSNYDWDISIDGGTPVRKRGNKSTTPISLPMSVGKHYVKITPHNRVTAGWARCMGNENATNSWNNNKNKLEFGLEWLPGYAFMRPGTSIRGNFLNATWSGCTSLTSMPNGFNLPQNITSVRDFFLYKTWYSCTSLTSIPSGFNIPQNITSAGNGFLSAAWENCTSLTSIPSGFNIPQNITSVGNYFLSRTWYNCPLLTSIPSGFNIPQNITSVGNDFLSSTWHGCASLTSMPNGFNIPQGITSVGGSFLGSTWNRCTSLTSMPNGFNLPQNITSVGEHFLNATWSGCTSLTSMPNGFNLPQNITSAGIHFLVAIWYNCTSLTSNSPAEPINFPNVSGGSYAGTCFGGSCPITPNTPTPGSSVMVHRG